jgi:hypothetical protein
MITTKYRSEETPANTSLPAVPKKINPARRSKLRLENFIRKKTDQKKTEQPQTGEQTLASHQAAPAAGDTASTSSQLIHELPGLFATRLNSPIPQLDGAVIAQHVKYSFKSEYGEEDILYSLSELLPENLAPNLVSRVRLGPRSADHLCTVVLQLPDEEIFGWPEMNSSDSEVMREIKRI